MSGETPGEEGCVKISVIIPAYNSEATIQATLDSVLRQTVPPDEILVMDDGSTDQTASILKSYEPRVTIFRQPNGGVARARNVLCANASGDLIAFLDHDDVWHPQYLEFQRKHFMIYPNAVAFFTGHVDFYGYEPYEWAQDRTGVEESAEVIDPPAFLHQLRTASRNFGSASFLCVPKRVLMQIGKEPFSERVSGGDDRYFCLLSAIYGSVVYFPFPLVAYRITREAQSADTMKSCGLGVEIFQLLEATYRRSANISLLREFQTGFASKRRSYAKLLMGAGRVEEAREQLRKALHGGPASVAKSLAWLFLISMPSRMHPTWPSSQRPLSGQAWKWRRWKAQ